MLFDTLKSTLRDYPLVSQERLRDLLLQDDDVIRLQRKEARLSRLMKLATLDEPSKQHFTEVKERLETDGLIRFLLHYTDTTPLCIFELLAKLNDVEGIDEDKLTELWFLSFQEQLKHEPNPLDLIKFLSFDDYHQFTGFLVFLLDRLSESATRTYMFYELMNSGLLQQFFQYNVGMDFPKIKKTYEAVETLAITKALPKEILELFKELVSESSSGLRGFERYALNGSLMENTLTVFKLNNRKNTYNKTEDNLIALHNLFGARFFIQLCIDSHRELHTWHESAFIKKSIEAIEDKELIELFLILNRELDGNSRNICINSIVYHFSKEQLKLLSEAGFFWPLVSRIGTFIDTLDENTLARYLSQKIHDADLQKAVMVCSRDSMKMHQTEVYQKVIKQLLLNPLLLENFSQPAIGNLSQNGSINFYCEEEAADRYATLHVFVNRHIKEGFSENAYIDLCDMARSQKSKISVLQRFVKTPLDFPMSNYALHALILQQASLLDEDFDLCHYLSIFHSELQYSDYPDPKKEQEEGQLRTLYETLLMSDNDALKDKIINTIKKDFSKALWWQVNINTKPFLEQFLAKNPTLVAKHLLPEGTDATIRHTLLRILEPPLIVDYASLFHCLIYPAELFELVLKNVPVMDRLSIVLQRNRQGITLIYEALMEDTLDPFMMLMTSLPLSDRVRAIKTADGTKPLLHEINDLESLKIALSFFTPSEQQELVLEKTDKGESLLTKHLLVWGGLNFFEDVVGKAILVNCLELSGILLQSLSNNDRNAFERGMQYLPEEDRERFMLQKMKNSVFVETVIGAESGFQSCLKYLSVENKKTVLQDMLSTEAVKSRLALHCARPNARGICTEGQLEAFSRVIKAVSELPAEHMIDVLRINIHEEQNMLETIIAMSNYSPLQTDTKSLFDVLLKIDKDKRDVLFTPIIKKDNKVLAKCLLNIKAAEYISGLLGTHALIDVLMDPLLASELIDKDIFIETLLCLGSEAKGAVILYNLKQRLFINTLLHNKHHMFESVLLQLHEKHIVPAYQLICVNYFINSLESIANIEVFLPLLLNLDTSGIFKVITQQNDAGDTLMHRLASLNPQAHFLSILERIPLEDRHKLLHLENKHGEKVIDLVREHSGNIEALKTLFSEEDREYVMQKAKRGKLQTEHELREDLIEQVIAIAKPYEIVCYSLSWFSDTSRIHQHDVEQFLIKLVLKNSLTEVRREIIDSIEETLTLQYFNTNSSDTFYADLLSKLLPNKQPRFNVHSLASYVHKLSLLKAQWGIETTEPSMEDDRTPSRVRTSLV